MVMMEMPTQKEIWNGNGGKVWVDAQTLLDRMFRPIERILAGAVQEAGASHLLEIGCGTGGVSVTVAEHVPDSGSYTGIDISEPMLKAATSLAQARNSKARFILGDPQEYDFKDAHYDMVISRFGVMFFSDSVQAFKNIRAACKPEAELLMACWRSPQENPFMTTTVRAVRSLLPDFPTMSPDAPGQFHFADQERVSTVLKDAGWTQIEVVPLDFEITMNRAELTQYALNLGPMSMILANLPPEKADMLKSTVLNAFEDFIEGDCVRFTAACHLYSARA